MKIFCSGIGGIGVSAYASHMQARGHEVSGSDKAVSATTDTLRLLGIDISFAQDGSAVKGDTDLFVYSEAIADDAPERQRARQLTIPQKSYFQALGDMTKGADLVCIAGTHGKSTTTAMLADVLIDAGKDPNVVLGTKSSTLGGKNWRKSVTNLWVVEACEYRRSFHALSPTMVLLTNADGDHFDAFKDHDEYKEAFVEFLGRLPANGTVMYHGSDADSVDIVRRSKRVGIDADDMPLPSLSVPGLHMRQNAQLVLKAAEVLGLDRNVAEKSLLDFTGTWRRMETKRTLPSGTTIIDDYAHHPKEIQATLSAMREKYPQRRIVCVFQPHTHDRTLKLWKDFSVSFVDADVVVLAGIYDARPDRDAAQADIVAFGKNIASGSDVKTLVTKSLSEAKDLIESGVALAGDILITMGAGDITKLSDSLQVP